MVLRRGFKSDANWYAREMRRALDLADDGPLCPWKLADHLGFPIVKLSAFLQAEPAAVAYFRTNVGQREFSALTIFIGSKRLIVHNDSHGEKRQASNIAHELAHGILLHPPKPPIDENGSRHYNSELEREADWLGPALLVSDEAAISIVKRQLTLSDASRIFNATEEVVRMRINVSGAVTRVRRRAA